MKQTGKIWKDHSGKEIPRYAINPVLRLEDKHANKIAEAAMKVEKHLREVTELTRAAHEEIYAAKIIDAKIKGSDRTPYDGMTISSFDNSIQVKITKPDNLTFDNTYTNLVKEKFDEYFATFDQASPEMSFIRELVKDLLFSTGGKIDQGKVLRLRKYRDRFKNSKTRNQKAMLFIEAVDIFDKAVRTKPGSTGIYIDVNDENGKPRRIPLKYTDI
jgi:hypothetical protein